ncbi:type I restriction endonuclease subunit R [Streptomyces sp. NPDC001212]
MNAYGTDMSESGLEALIVADMGQRGWLQGDSRDYDRTHAVDFVQLRAFLEESQPSAAAALELTDPASPVRRKFLARLQGQVTQHGVVHLLRHGLQHGPHDLTLFYGSPSPGNRRAEELHALNRFTVSRQVRYSQDETQRALDLVIFVNGLPVATFELKNNVTKQTAQDAVEQYQRDRDPREPLFKLGRCLVHLALDDQVVRFCTHLKGRTSWFLPFDQGWNHGAGNPPNPDGLKTAYLWQSILAPTSLTDIIEHYALRLERKDIKTGRKQVEQIFPRYHQLDVVRQLLANGGEFGAGQRYLIQHSAGSGKSNSIAWLALQLIGLKHHGSTAFDSVIVVTDRVNLDQQIRDTIRQFSQVRSTVTHAAKSGDLRRSIEAGKKIIISTVQKFPFVLDDIGTAHRNRRFAIVIDEAHSSQGGKATTAMSTALSPVNALGKEEDSTEDKINQIMDRRKLPANASFYAFTATPKNKTLELFGQRGGDGKPQPFHSYTMKQAIQEGFILDVLKNYLPVTSYYKLAKTVEVDPEFDSRRATKKLRSYVEGNDHAIRVKAEVMVEHFLQQVVGLRKVGGRARAMVVTSSIDRAIEYYHAISAHLRELKSPYKAIVAFSGEHDYGGVKVTEATLNHFSSGAITERIQEDPYRILVCADKFQTGYDEPLLHTMYVDKPLSGIKAVQTLSRLNRAHPDKRDVAILDFYNDTAVIEEAFSKYYRTTVLSETTDPNKLHDLKAALDGYGVYLPEHVEVFVDRYLEGAERDRLDPILDACVATYCDELDKSDQISFKGKAKAFTRTYDFLASVLPYSHAGWEKLSILLNFLILKLPAPREDDLSRGILETVSLESYRVEKQVSLSLTLTDEDAEIGPVPTASTGSHAREPELERISAIIRTFNNQFGNIPWTDKDRIQKIIAEEIPTRVAADPAYQRAMRNSDKQNARIEHDHALGRVMISLIKDQTELFKQFSDNDAFKRWLANTVFDATYDRGEGHA